MKRIFNRLTVFVMTLLIISTAAFTAAVPAAAAELQPVTVTVELTEGSGYAQSNLNKLQNALAQAKSGTMLTVKIAVKGVYYVGGNGGGGLALRPNTMLDFNGSTMMRAGDMYNLIQNVDYNGNRNIGGYALSSNVGFMNGTVDGTGGNEEEVNLVNLGHADGVTIKNVHFQNCRNGHMIELSGCKNAVISDCTFNGYIGAADGCNEAVQLDISYTDWNGAYTSDMTPCKNVTVTGCTFYDFPSGVGNHHTAVGAHNTGITISDNQFYNKLKTAQPAVWCYAFDNSTVSGNVISGNYETGIAVSGGSVDVKDNTVTDVSYMPVNVTVSNSYLLNGTNKSVEETTTGGSVTGNRLSSTGAEGLAVYHGSKLSEISGNTIRSTASTALMISGNVTVGNIKNNSLSSTADCGLWASKSTVDMVSNNTIRGKNHAIYLTSGAYIDEIDFNTLSSADESGICVTGSSCGYIIGNTISDCGENGIHIASAGKVSRIQANTITGCKGYGFVVYNANITVAIGDNTFSGNQEGSYYSKAKTTAAPKYERTDMDTPVITDVSNVYGGVRVTWNRVNGAVKYRVFYRNGSGGWSKLGDTTSTSMTDTVVTSGKTYTYTVRCLTSDGSKYASSFDPDGKSVTYVAAPAAKSVSCVRDGVKLTWTAVPGAAGYRVFYRNKNGGWSKLGDTSDTTLTDTAVSSGTTYTYTIRCLDTNGKYCSGYNDTGWKGTFVTTPIISGAQNTNSGVQLTWNAVRGAAKYRVFYQNKNNNWVKLGDTTGTVLTDTVVSSGATYIYTVRALNSSGSYVSDYDHDGYHHTYVKAPEFSVGLAHNGVKISWGAVRGASNYRVFYLGGGKWKKLVDTSDTSVVDTDVRDGKNYTYTVRCLNEEGTAYISDFLSGKSTAFYLAPTLKASNTEDAVRLSWNRVDSAAKYRVFYKNKKGGWTKLGDTAGTSMTDSVVSSGTSYTYTIRTLNSAGNYLSSFDGNGVTITFIKAPEFTVANDTDGVSVTWNAVKGAEKYRVFRRNGSSWTPIADTAETSFKDVDVVSDTTYQYTVRCISADGGRYTGDYRAGKSVDFYPAPVLRLSDTGSGVGMQWDAVPGAAKYRVFYKTAAGGWKKLVDTADLTYTDTDVKAGKTYTYTIRVLNSAGKYLSSFYPDGFTVTYQGVVPIEDMTGDNQTPIY